MRLFALFAASTSNLGLQHRGLVMRKLELKLIKTPLVALLAAATRDPRLGAACNLHALLLAQPSLRYASPAGPAGANSRGINSGRSTYSTKRHS